MNNINYWENYYKSHEEPFENSSFSKFVLKYIDKNDTIIDLGCGNGRDSIFLSGFNKVVGIDGCEFIVNKLKNRESSDLKFKFLDFNNISQVGVFDHAYSRFSLHSINEDLEDKILKWCRLNVKKYLFIESRCDRVKDPNLYSDHYRRFLNFEDTICKIINLGYKLEYAECSSGFSPYDKKFDVDNNENDPILMRIVAKTN